MKGIARPFRIDLSFNSSVVKTRIQTIHNPGNLQKMFGNQLIFKQTSKQVQMKERTMQIM